MRGTLDGVKKQIPIPEAGSWSLVFHGRQLLPQGEIFQEEVRPRSGERPDYLNDDRDDDGEESREGQHGCGILADGTRNLKPL
jgi:hypothetical protein